MSVAELIIWLPRFGNNLSEDPHSVVVAHVFKIDIVHLFGMKIRYIS